MRTITIESAEHEHGGWTRATRPVSRPLRGLLDRDPVGFADHGTAPLSWVDVPSTAVSVILSCGEPYAGLPRAFVAGLTETWSVVDLGACGASIDLKLTPLGAYELLGMPMDELSGRVVDLGELLGPATRAPCSTGSPPPTTGRRDSTSSRACSPPARRPSRRARRPRSRGPGDAWSPAAGGSGSAPWPARSAGAIAT